MRLCIYRRLENPSVSFSPWKVLAGRQLQLDVKMQDNRQAQEESLRRREELIEELELERQTRRQEREEDEGHRTARMQEINAQVGGGLQTPILKGCMKGLEQPVLTWVSC